MGRKSKRIPKRDYIGDRVWINDKALIFSNEGISWEGKVIHKDGKRWLEVEGNEEEFLIGSIGNMQLLKVYSN